MCAVRRTLCGDKSQEFTGVTPLDRRAESTPFTTGIGCGAPLCLPTLSAVPKQEQRVDVLPTGRLMTGDAFRTTCADARPDGRPRPALREAPRDQCRAAWTPTAFFQADMGSWVPGPGPVGVGPIT